MAGIKRSAPDASSQPSKKARPSSQSSNPKPKQFDSSETHSKPKSGKKLDYNTKENKWNRQQYQDKKEAREFPHFDSSREAHAAQRTLTAQRKLGKPNGDSIHRAKKIWERLRIKSAVPLAERKELVEELFGIIREQVKEYVFKHDSVRVVQCALKYANKAQRSMIVEELRGSYRELAESRYGKFLVGKLVGTSNEARDVVVGEFEGAVKRLIRHAEAGWILDDVYRGAATIQQRGRLVREWYGAEFVILNQEKRGGDEEWELAKILERHPEKRGPIMGHLKEMINLLVQKKTTGFTMLHDAMLQYFLNTKVGSPEQTEFLEMLKDDEEGDCMRNMAFTKSGSRLVCLALAYGNAKDRRNILRFFKTHVLLMAADANACRVLLTADEVIDDTVMTAKAMFPELMGKEMSTEDREASLMSMANSVTARMALLYPMAPEPQKWLVTEEEINIINEVREIRKQTSKKEPEKRRTELVEALSQSLLDFVASAAQDLAQGSFGCQFMAEVLLGGIGDKAAASEAVLNVVDTSAEVIATPHFGRMLKSLVQGGRFDPATKTIIQVDPPLSFHNILYERITSVDEKAILAWATGANSWIVLNMLEAQDFSHKEQLKKFLKAHIEVLEVGNTGSQKILEAIGGGGKKREVKTEDWEPLDEGEAVRMAKKTKSKK